MPSLKKLILLGLDYAGKTSILKVLTQEYHQLGKMKPTVGINRKILNLLGDTIILWDFGGQETYRNEYIKDLKLFTETHSLFFIIDILNPSQFELALQYFTTILILLESLGITPPIHLCLHKTDPELREQPEIRNSINRATQLFLTNSRGHQITIYHTSIYDIKSIIHAFSNTFEEIILPLHSFTKILESLTNQFNLDGTILLNSQLLFLSEYYTSDACKETCLNTVYKSVKSMQTIHLSTTDKKFIQTFEDKLNTDHRPPRFRIFKIKFRKWDLFLITIGAHELNSSQITAYFDFA